MKTLLLKTLIQMEIQTGWHLCTTEADEAIASSDFLTIMVFFQVMENRLWSWKETSLSKPSNWIHILKQCKFYVLLKCI